MPSSPIDLRQAIFDLIEKRGTKDAATFFGKGEPTIQKWQSGTAFPDISAAQKILDLAYQQGLELPEESEPEVELEEEIPVELLKPKSTTTEGPKEQPPAPKLVKTSKFLIPTTRDFAYTTVLSILGNWKSAISQEQRDALPSLDIEADTTCVFSRNRLATRFLESGEEWAFWIDSDMLLPIGNPSWYQRRSGKPPTGPAATKSAYEQLMSRGQKFIGGVYVARNTGAQIVASPEMDSQFKDEDVAREIRQGPKDKIVPVKWMGFGCVLTHRQVFLDILEKVEGVKSDDPKQKPHEFFTPWNGGYQGEDMAFNERAIMAGHQPYLDLALHCGHIGRYCYMPEPRKV